MKIIHKLTMILTKYIPVLECIFSFIYLLLGFNGIIIDQINYLFGGCLITDLYFLINSFTFKFCSHYRVAIYYLLGLLLFNIIDSFIPFELPYFYYIIIIGITFSFSCILFCYLKNKDNKNRINAI